MRLHTNTLTASDAYDAVRGHAVPELAWKHVDTTDRTRTADYCGHGYALGIPAGLTPEGTEEACRHGRTVRYVATGALTYSGPVDVIGNLPGVGIDAMAHGSRSHVRSLEVKLTGTSTRRPNDRGASDDYAATWDEWGMFLARMFAADPDMVAGTVKNPIYACADHFRWSTGGRYDTLTADAQHRNHRWEFSGMFATGNASVFECSGGKSPCGAIRRMLRGDTWATSPVSADVTGAHR